MNDQQTWKLSKKSSKQTETFAKTIVTSFSPNLKSFENEIEAKFSTVPADF